MIIMLQIIFSQLTIVLGKVSMVVINELKNLNSHKKLNKFINKMHTALVPKIEISSILMKTLTSGITSYFQQLHLYN